MSAPTSTSPHGGKVGDTAGAAKESGQAVAGSAADHAHDLAGTASEKASDVIGEAKSQATDLLDNTREQVRSEAENRRGQAVTSLRAIGDELDSMQSHDGDHGIATELAGRGGDYVRRTADWLDGREPSQILDDVRHFARERPGTFLIGALLAGVVAGRLTRAVKAGPPSTPASNGEQPRTDLASARTDAAPFASSQELAGVAQGTDPVIGHDDDLVPAFPNRPVGAL